jgi:CAAX protease family protein
VGIVVNIIVFASLTTKRLKPLGHPMTGLSKGDADRLALRMCGVVVLFVLIPTAIAAPLKPYLGVDTLALVSELFVLAAVVVFLKFEIMGKADTYSRLVGRRDQWPKLCLYGIAGFAASLPVTITMALVMTTLFKDQPKPTHPITEQIGAGTGPLTILMFFVLVVVMAPLLEEISFRGMLFPALGRYIGPVGGILVSAFLFGAIHPQGPVLWAALASIGAFSALLAYLTRSLIPSMVLHACQNAMTLTVAIVFLY